MKNTTLQLGGIYLTESDKRAFRIIAFDDVEVLYDCLWSDNEWMFSSNMTKKCSFYRYPSKLFLERSQLIDYLPLSQTEIHTFRPDLPLRAGRTKAFDWNNFKTTKYKEFQDLFREANKDNMTVQNILTDKIVLIPLGNKGGLKKSVIVTAKNQTFFEVTELLWKAKELQETVNSTISNGIGIYRMGIEKSLPSYYIGEYLDLSNFLKDEV